MTMIATVLAQQITPPVTDPVIVLLLRALSVILALLLSAASIRAFIFFGSAVEAQKNLTRSHDDLKDIVGRAGEKFEQFAKEIREVLGDHEGRLILREAAATDHERRLGEFERRHRGRRTNDP